MIYPASELETVTAALILEKIKESVTNEFSDQFDPVIRFAKALPAFSGNILEMHVDKQEGCFDFAYRLNSRFDKAILDHLQDNNHRFNNKEYFQLLDTSKTGFTHGIKNIWFEYDAPFKLTPALFFDINREKDFYPEGIISALQEIACSFNYPIPIALPDFLQKLKSLHLYVVYYGFMFSRKSAAIRLTINGIKAQHLIDILIAVGWPGNYQHLVELKENYLHDDQKLVLAVDFDQQVNTRIGIEVFEHDYSHLAGRYIGT